MTQILISAFLLSIIHASIPNHWLPLVAISKVENWSRVLTLRATLISGIAHIASTIVIGLLVGWVGLKFATQNHSLFRIIAPSILIGTGLIYIVLHLTTKNKHHPHHEKKIKKTSITAIIVSISVGMFFSPCIELQSYYFKAGDFGWQGILSVSVIYLVVTVAMMMLLVSLALKGIQKFNLHSLEHNERLIIGIILFATGIITVIV